MKNYFCTDSVEEQVDYLIDKVRYDAEQIQVLKQADVTINENLQTINTEIDGKLDKPTNPSAESAVTMLADGTVGTKLLSEIGGGGGKLYMHKIDILVETFASVLVFYLYNRISTEMTLNDIAGRYFVASVTGGMNTGVASCIIKPSTTPGSTHKLTSDGVLTSPENNIRVLKDVAETNDMIVTDTVTEL